MPRSAKIDMPGLLQHVIVREIVSTLFVVTPEDIHRRARHNSILAARSVFCYLAIRKLGKSGTESADISGWVRQH